MTTTTTFAAISTTELTALATSKVSRSAILVYMAISSHLRGFEGSTSAFPSIKRIMALLGGSVARSTVFEALNQLKKAGLIKTERTTERKSNTYHLRVREVIKKAMAFVQGQNNEKQSFKGNKKYRGPENQTQSPKHRTLKRNPKRENTSIDYDTIMSQWIVNGEHPELGVLQKIPDAQLAWLKAYHPHLWEQVRALVV